MNASSLLVLAAAAVAGIGAACLPGPKTQDPAKAEPAQDGIVAFQQSSSMTDLYNQNCAKCHGLQGEGGGGGTKSLNTKEKFDQKWDKPFFDAIKNGVPDMGMEAYGQTMKDEQIWGLVVHMRELQARALRREFPGPRPTAGVYRSDKGVRYRVENVVTSGLRTPWALDWLPDGRMLITNRPGYIVIEDKGKVSEQVMGLPPVLELGQGGLMEVAVHPNYARNGWIYLGYTEPSKSNPRAGMTKIVRGKLDLSGPAPVWKDQQTIFEAAQDTYTQSGVHFGNRIVFDGKGNIFFAIGERGNARLSQDLTKPNGKVYRVREDGSIPSDNPFVNTPGALKAIWSYGHRNPQGLVFGLDGTLYDTEHGPRGGDELNIVKKGANYGWPTVSYSINYNDAPFTTPWPQPGQSFEVPVFRWLPSIGQSGLDVVRGDAFPQWRGDLLAGGLAGQNLDRIKVVNGKMTEREEILFGMGRVRDVSVHKDGSIYVALNGPDKVVCIVPVR